MPIRRIPIFEVVYSHEVPSDKADPGRQRYRFNVRAQNIEQAERSTLARTAFREAFERTGLEEIFLEGLRVNAHPARESVTIPQCIGSDAAVTPRLVQTTTTGQYFVEFHVGDLPVYQVRFSHEVPGDSRSPPYLYVVAAESRDDAIKQARPHFLSDFSRTGLGDVSQWDERKNAFLIHNKIEVPVVLGAYEVTPVVDEESTTRRAIFIDFFSEVEVTSPERTLRQLDLPLGV